MERRTGEVDVVLGNVVRVVLVLSVAVAGVATAGRLRRVAPVARIAAADGPDALTRRLERSLLIVDQQTRMEAVHRLAAELARQLSVRCVRVEGAAASGRIFDPSQVAGLLVVGAAGESGKAPVVFVPARPKGTHLLILADRHANWFTVLRLLQTVCPPFVHFILYGCLDPLSGRTAWLSTEMLRKPEERSLPAEYPHKLLLSGDGVVYFDDRETPSPEVLARRTDNLKGGEPLLLVRYVPRHNVPFGVLLPHIHALVRSGVTTVYILHKPYQSNDEFVMWDALEQYLEQRPEIEKRLRKIRKQAEDLLAAFPPASGDPAKTRISLTPEHPAWPRLETLSESMRDTLHDGMLPKELTRFCDKIDAITEYEKGTLSRADLENALRTLRYRIDPDEPPDAGKRSGESK